jgi:mRNA-degrading endonuclease RelE of RelBE toxin-antitoxin system
MVGTVCHFTVNRDTQKIPAFWLANYRATKEKGTVDKNRHGKIRVKYSMEYREWVVFVVAFSFVEMDYVVLRSCI